MSVCLSVRPPAQNNSAPTRQISWNLVSEYFSKTCQQNSSYKLKFDRINEYLTARRNTFKMESLSAPLSKRNVSGKPFILNNLFRENLAVYEIMWKNIVERGRSLMTIWCMRIACWISKATNTHSQYVILVAFPLQQWVHESPSQLSHTNIDCLFFIFEFPCITSL